MDVIDAVLEPVTVKERVAVAVRVVVRDADDVKDAVNVGDLLLEAVIDGVPPYDCDTDAVTEFVIVKLLETDVVDVNDTLTVLVADADTDEP